MQDLLSRDARLSAEVQSALESNPGPQREALVLLRDVVHEVGAEEALTRLKNWLQGKKSVRDPQVWEELAFCLSALGVKDSHWLKEQRGRYSAAQLKSLGLPDQPLEVPGPAWPFSAELVVAALEDRPVCWNQRADRPSHWMGEDYVSVPSTVDLADRDDRPASRLERFVRNFLTLRGLPVTRILERDFKYLKDHLRQRELGRPYYTEEHPHEPLFQQPQLREILLILRRDPARDEVVHTPVGLEEVLRQMLEKLRRLENADHPNRPI